MSRRRIFALIDQSKRNGMKNPRNFHIPVFSLVTLVFVVQILTISFPGRIGAQHLDVEHYTSGAAVVDIVRDGDYLWTAQFRGGLTRMSLSDGSMTHFNHVNSGLLANDVTCVRVAPNGEVWAGTSFGLARFDGEDWKIYRSNNSPLSATPMIADIVIDDNNIIWIASGSVLYRFDGKNSWQLFAPGNSPLPSGQMNSLELDKDGVFWISYNFGVGVVRFDGTNAVHYTTANSGLTTNNIDRIWIDPQGNKWFGSSTTAVGLVRFDGTSWSTLGPSGTTLASGIVNDMAFPGSGGMWIGSNGGLQFFDGLSWTNYNQNNSPMPGSTVMSLLLDAGDGMWVGFYHGVAREVPVAVNEMASLARFSGTTWSFYQVGNSPLPNPWVSRIVFDKSGDPWINTYGGGVIHYDGMDWDWKHLGNSPMPGSYISDAAVDHEGSLWMAIDGYGLTRKKGDQWSVIAPSNSQFPSYWPSAIANAADGGMWFGTKEGHLVKFDGMNWVIYHPNQTPLPPSLITKIVVDTMNTAWLSYYSWNFPGVVRFGEGVWTHFTADNSNLPSNIINDMVVDGDNHVWFGTQAGLARFNGMEWEVFTPANSPIASSQILRLALDDNDMLWIHTNAGIMSFDGKEQWALFPNPVAGSADIDRLPLHMQAGPDGRLWIGTITGLLVFDPMFPAPEIVLSVGQLLFDSVEIGDCSFRDYELYGAALDHELLVEAPAGFTLAVHPDSVFVSGLMLVPNNGEVTQTVFVAFCPTEEKHYQDVILHTSAGADAGLLGVDGVGYQITGVEQAWQHGELQVYPNPARGLVTVALKNPPVDHPGLDMFILTMHGRLASHHIWPDHQAFINIDISHLSGGLYLLEVCERATGRRLSVTSLVVPD
jgi:ligand-binding sensor domain-containing protein